MAQKDLLLWRLNNGDEEVLRDIYYEYKNDMLALAGALIKATALDAGTAEDVVHDVFVSFAGRIRRIKLRTNVKGYLLTSIANRVRNLQKNSRSVNMVEADKADNISPGPEYAVISAERRRLIDSAMHTLPYEQKEVITLHLAGGLAFKAIAKAQGVSINTIQSRYRYGLKKLQSVLNGKV